MKPWINLENIILRKISQVQKGQIFHVYEVSRIGKFIEIKRINNVMGKRQRVTL